MRVVQGQAQHYDWGDPDAIPGLLGRRPDGRPWAEFWWGTHRAAPSTVDGVPLSELTGPLPYLVKLLAAARPLSLQLHPDARQAAAGYAREQSEGLALDHPTRTYRDPWPKPELVCALTRFEAVCGLADTTTVETRLTQLSSPADELATRYRALGPRAVVAWLLTSRPEMNEVVTAAGQIAEPWAQWMVRVADTFPGDPAVGALPLLRHVVLQPGEALFLGAGHLHAYLHGVGVEVMGPSDNVVRGGLTSKYVDIEALVSLMRDDVLYDPVVATDTVEHGDATVVAYRTPEAPFAVERWSLDGVCDLSARSDELWWCLRGDVGVATQGICVLFRTGEPIRLRGQGEVFRITA